MADREELVKQVPVPVFAVHHVGRVARVQLGRGVRSAGHAGDVDVEAGVDVDKARVDEVAAVAVAHVGGRHLEQVLCVAEARVLQHEGGVGGAREAVELGDGELHVDVGVPRHVHAVVGPAQEGAVVDPRVHAVGGGELEPRARHVVHHALALAVGHVAAEEGEREVVGAAGDNVGVDPRVLEEAVGRVHRGVGALQELEVARVVRGVGVARELQPERGDRGVGVKVKVGARNVHRPPHVPVGPELDRGRECAAQRVAPLHLQHHRLPRHLLVQHGARHLAPACHRHRVVARVQRGPDLPRRRLDAVEVGHAAEHLGAERLHEVRVHCGVAAERVVSRAVRAAGAVRRQHRVAGR